MELRKKELSGEKKRVESFERQKLEKNLARKIWSKMPSMHWRIVHQERFQLKLKCQTAEKKPISDLCSTGLYFFNKKQDYLDSYYEYLLKPEEEWENGEIYIAPLYNKLIERGKQIHFFLIEKNDVIFCGTPSEFTEFQKIEPKTKQHFEIPHFVKQYFVKQLSINIFIRILNVVYLLFEVSLHRSLFCTKKIEVLW